MAGPDRVRPGFMKLSTPPLALPVAQVTVPLPAASHSTEMNLTWRSATGVPAPAQGVVLMHAHLSAASALHIVRSGDAVRCDGDYLRARKLLTEMGQLLIEMSSPHATTVRNRSQELAQETAALTAAFDATRRFKALSHLLLTRLVVVIEGRDYRPRLVGAPPLGVFGDQVWGPMPANGAMLVPLREWVGAVGAREWYTTGIKVPVLDGRIHPRFGVFAPTRSDYLGLFADVAGKTIVKGKTVFDIGTGTGVLGLILARLGAARVTLTDADPRAAACADENATRLGFEDVVEAQAVEPDAPFPSARADTGHADLIVCNPPWLPADAPTAYDRAVYDPGGRLVNAFVNGLGARLKPGGRGWLILSDLAEQLGLRAPGAIESAAGRAGLLIVDRHTTPARKPKPRGDRADPLHGTRSRETISLYVLGR